MSAHTGDETARRPGAQRVEHDAPAVPSCSRARRRDHSDAARGSGARRAGAPAPAAGRVLARRFRDRGEPLEDLVQVATMGLIKAVDRFDPDRGVEFSTYATPTMVGEIKRHFRDKGWAIRVPRRLQELRMRSAGDRRADPEAGPLPHRRRARRVHRRLGRGDPGGHGVRQGVRDPVPRRLRRHRRRRRACRTRSARDPNLEHVEARETIKPLLDGSRRGSGGSCCCGSSRT